MVNGDIKRTSYLGNFCGRHCAEEVRQIDVRRAQDVATEMHRSRHDGGGGEGSLRTYGDGDQSVEERMTIIMSTGMHDLHICFFHFAS